MEDKNRLIGEVIHPVMNLVQTLVRISIYRLVYISIYRSASYRSVRNLGWTPFPIKRSIENSLKMDLENEFDK